MFDEVFEDSNKLTPTNFFACVNAFKSNAVELFNKEFFISHLSCFD
jgi:hypothetical protein